MVSAGRGKAVVVGTAAVLAAASFVVVLILGLESKGARGNITNVQSRNCVRTNSKCTCAPVLTWSLELVHPQAPESLRPAKTCVLGQKRAGFQCDCNGNMMCNLQKCSKAERLAPIGPWNAGGGVSCEYQSASSCTSAQPLLGENEKDAKPKQEDHEFNSYDSFRLGEKVRRIGVPRIFSEESTMSELEEIRESLLADACENCLPPAPQGCWRWIVAQVTSQQDAKAIANSVKQRSEWCSVFIANVDSGSEWSKSMQAWNAVVLGQAEQKELQSEVLMYLPRNHTARKMVGYLYAIKQNPKAIYDADSMYPIQDAGLVTLALNRSTQIATKMDQRITLNFNPLPEAHPAPKSGQKGDDTPKSPARDPFLWPRGFPLNDVPDFRTTGALDSGSFMDSSKVGVLHSIADGFPDTDAVFSLTRKPQRVRFNRQDWIDTLPETLRSIQYPSFLLGRWTRAVPKGIFVPYNAHSSLLAANSFWSLWMPSSRPARAADMWRSYIMQRLMWDEDVYVAVTEPFVGANERSSADAREKKLSNLEEELDFQHKIDALVRVLTETDVSGEHTAARLEYLIIELYERGFLDLQDVLLAQAWIRDLLRAGYRFKHVHRDNLYIPLPKTSPDYLPSFSVVRKSFPDAKGGSNQKGKVAVCISGQFRGFTHKSNAIDERYPIQSQQSGEAEKIPITKHPSDTMREFLFPVLAQHGFDLFMHVPTSEKYTWEPLMNETNACDALRPGSSDRYKLFCNIELEPSEGIPVPRSKRWTSFPRSPTGLVAQLHGMYRCNEMRKERERTTGMRYDYMIRWRSDGYMMSKIPPLSEVFISGMIGMNSPRACCCGNRDSFGIGFTEEMQYYFDRVALLGLSDINAAGTHWIAERFGENVAQWLDGARIGPSMVRYCIMPRRAKHDATTDKFLRNKTTEASQ
mmetsp:Transcript_17423/g.37827  ORF Transcript_17423/g.37827 Transcript_17423/m.37827 type:complete len:919 (+) Transcript_17423:2-2758(+)